MVYAKKPVTKLKCQYEEKMGKMNIYDIAKKANVSPATVSRVLNGNQSVREKTRKKVQQIIDESNYVPNSLARSLSVGDIRNIAFLAPDIENSFFSKILHGLSDTASQYDYNVFMYGTNDDLEVEHRMLEGIRKEMVKGVVLIPVTDNDERTIELLKGLEKNQIPVVLLDRDIRGENFDGVYSDDCKGAKDAVNCLIEGGHKKIAIVTGDENTRPGRERLKGYRKALKEAGIEEKPDYIVNGHFKENMSYKVCQKLMELPDPPTAIFSSNNLTTLGCLKYMKEHKIRIGKDISLVGFDEIHELTYTELELTVVDRPIYEMGCAALELFEMSVRSMEEGRNKVLKHTSLVETKLIRRGSEKLKK